MLMGLWLNPKEEVGTVRPMASGARRQKARSDIFPGCQWGEPVGEGSTFSVKVSGEHLTVTAAMPMYEAGNQPCDLIRQYETVRRNRSIGKQRTGKDSPHICFANASCDDELIDFVRRFGPVVGTNVTYTSKLTKNQVIILLKASQDLGELRDEQRTYKAVLSLILELAKPDAVFDFGFAQARIVDIATGVRAWPHQWERERKERGANPGWRPSEHSIQRITALADSKPDFHLPPKVDTRIVICEVLNVFPGRFCPNLVEMHSGLRFGIRPLLYAVLGREFLYHRDSGVCANTHCRQFFEIERAGQQYCDEECSRRQRQREYWRKEGKGRRQDRLERARTKRKTHL